MFILSIFNKWKGYIMKMLSIVKKNLVVICCLCLFMSILSVNVFAQGNDRNVNAVVVINEPYVVETDNGHLIFENYLDMVTYLYLHGLNVSERSTCLPGDPWYPTCKDYSDKYKYRSVIIKREVKDMQIGFHTSNWDMVSSYALDRSEGYKLSFTLGAVFDNIDVYFTVDFSNSPALSKVYSADQNRFSKLEARAEIEFIKYRMELYDPKTNKVMKTFYYTRQNVLNTYSRVIYR